MKRTAQLLTVMLAMALLAPGTLLAQVGLPTIPDLEADLKAGNYQDVIRKVQQISSARNVAGQYDKARLMELRGEAQLHLKQTGPAAESFTAAAKETKDEKQQNADKAIALLARRSPGANYVPKNPPDGSEARGTTRQPPISIIDEESRKEAFKALLNDEMKSMKPKVDALERVTSLVPLLKGMQEVNELRAVELAGTGKDLQTAALVEGLANQASQLMSNALGVMAENVKRINESANKTSVDMVNLPNGAYQQVSTKHGLNSNDATTLQDVINTCGQIVEVCKTMGSSGKAAAAMKTVGAKAEQLAVQADQTLKADYGGNTSDVSNVIDSTRNNLRGNTNTRGNANPNTNVNPNRNPNPNNRSNTRGGN
jgi:hypothetical protein